MFGWRSQEHFEVNEKKKVNVHINGDFEHGKGDILSAIF
jgi:hypothetical protein